MVETRGERPRSRSKKLQSLVRPLEEITRPVLRFNLADEISRLQEDVGWPRTGRSAKTLVKQPTLRVVLTLLRGGTRIKAHKTEARMSVHTITGHLCLNLPDGAVDLPAGYLLVLERGLAHDVEALDDSVFLLTLS
jgi:quercetin dioxygenase-like cupin family protein